VQGNLNEKFDLVAPDKNMGKANIEGWITLEAAKKLFAMAGQDFDALKKQALTREFKPVPLGVTASMAVANTLRTIDSRNVVAKLEGTDPALKDEYVVYSAHWDHLGVGAPVNGDTIYNGALDNATGVAGLLAVAKAMVAMPRPRRSILFAAVAAEEQGLLGSKYLAAHPPIPAGRIAANVNVDGLNIWGRTKDFTMVGLGKSDLDDWIRGIAAYQGRTVVPDQFPDKGFFYRSDQFALARIGVPAAYFDAGTEVIGKPAGWGKQQQEAFEAKHYHQVSDELRDDWNFSGAVEDAQLLLYLGEKVANATALPAWRPGDEFEAARKKALAELNQ